MSEPARAPQAAIGSPVRYVCMPGTPFTGSTLLGTLLNEHPACSSIGAATGLIGRVDLSSYHCSCGRLFTQCEFWVRIAHRTRELGHPVNVFKTKFWNTHLRMARNRVVNALLVRSWESQSLNDLRDAVVGRVSTVRKAVLQAGWNTWSLATAVLESTGKQVFVDTARDRQRPKYLATHPMLDVRVIHLARDPRGNVASMMKHQRVSAASAARQWMRNNAEAARLRRYVPEHSWMSLRYEDFCADPAGVLDRISDFIGVERANLRLGAGGERHIIGNKMRMKALAEIKEDLSWQSSLGSAELVTIARIAGSTSHQMGYTWP
ncbi:MAG TPA: sulfotransferase [Gemmatimonadales bacterium]